MGKTTVAAKLDRERIWINKDGQVIKRGDGKPSRTDDEIAAQEAKEKETEDRLSKVEDGLEEIKDLLKKALQK